MALVVHTVQNHRVYEIKQERKLIHMYYTAAAAVLILSYTILGDHELRVVEDPPHQLFDIHDQFTQTGGDTDSEVAHRSGKLECNCNNLHLIYDIIVTHCIPHNMYIHMLMPCNC